MYNVSVNVVEQYLFSGDVGPLKHGAMKLSTLCRSMSPLHKIPAIVQPCAVFSTLFSSRIIVQQQQQQDQLTN